MPGVGVFDAFGKEYATQRDVEAAMQQHELVNINVEFLDVNGGRVTTVAHPFRPNIAALIDSVRIIPDVPV